MELSRKQKRELVKLRRQAESVLGEQREVLSHLGELAQEAGRHAKDFSDTYVAPKVNDAFDTVRPTLDRGVSAAQRFGQQARLAVAPVLATALASTIRGLERVENADAAKKLQAFGVDRGIIEAPKKKGRFGAVLAIGAGIAAAGAVGYALWQAFRSDDELWVAPEDGPAA